MTHELARNDLIMSSACLQIGGNATFITTKTSIKQQAPLFEVPIRDTFCYRTL